MIIKIKDKLRDNPELIIHKKGMRYVGGAVMVQK